MPVAVQGAYVVVPRVGQAVLLLPANIPAVAGGSNNKLLKRKKVIRRRRK